MKKPVLIAYMLLTMMTIAYCVLIWYAISLLSVLSDPVTKDVPILWFGMIPAPFSLYFIAVHWQLLALLSLFISLVWGVRRSSIIEDNSAYCLPIVMHLIWILFAIMIHGIGTIAPMISIGNIIS